MSEADKILCRAEGLKDRSSYRQAVRLYKEALRGYAKLRDREGAVHCMLSLGDTYRMTGDFDLAVTRYRDAIRTAREVRSPVKVADAKIGLGLALRAQGRWKEALKLIRESKSEYLKRHDREGIAFSLWAEAGAFRIKGDIREAIRTYRESHKFFMAMKDDSGIGYCLCGLGGGPGWPDYSGIRSTTTERRTAFLLQPEMRLARHIRIAVSETHTGCWVIIRMPLFTLQRQSDYTGRWAIR